MANWNQINEEIERCSSDNACDKVRSKYICELSSRTKTPVIAYYSGWLQKKQPDGRVHAEATITDNDMNGFMATVQELNRDNGLSLILHTPGGDIEAGRIIVEYLYKIFGKNIYAYVPQMAMSVGTMIACGCQTITMGKHSCLGPTDPQVNGIPAMGVLAEVDRAISEMKTEPMKQILWQQVFSKYPPAFISNCERAVEQTKTMVIRWLESGMFSGDADARKCAEDAVSSLMDYTGTSAHNHHFLIDKCKTIGLKINDLECDQNIQESVLSVHHSFMATFSRTSNIKIIENSKGSLWAVDQG